MANPPNGGDSLDTGIGGFEIPPEVDPSGRGGIYTYDPGDPDRPVDPDYPERNIALHGGNVSVDHSKKDLSRTTKLTLGHFLGKSTRGKNLLPIDVPVDSNDQKESLLTRNVDGSTPPIKESENSVTFVKRDTFYGSSIDRWTKPEGPVGWQGGRQPGEEFVVPNVSQIPLSKGFDKPPGTAFTGHTLLPSVDVDPAPVRGYTLSSLYNNRFDPNLQFLVREDLNPERPGDKFEDIVDFNVQFSHPTFGKVTTNQMTQIAAILTQNAAGGKDLINLTESAQGGYTQKIEAAKLEIDRIINILPPDSNIVPNFVSIAHNGHWGVMNHPGRIFVGGILSWESNVIAFLNAAAIGLLAAGVGFTSFILDSIGEAAGEQYYRDIGTSQTYFDHPKQPEPPGAFSLLKSAVGSVIDLPRTKTENPYWECLLRGSWNFFTGLDWTVDNFAGTISRGFNAITNMHQTLPVSRVVTRAFDTLVNQQGKIDNREEVTALIKSVFSGKIMDIMNTFATMGDAILERNRFKRILKLTQDRLGRDNITDPMVSDFTALHLKKNENGWGTSGTKSLFLAPIGYRMKRSGGADVHVVSALPGNLPGLTLTSTKNREEVESFTKSKLSKFLGRLGIKNKLPDLSFTRIPTKISTRIESELESEYVPFYFHDVRTNEIISFHAFLESLQDSFAASVESTDGMGRVEPIKIYKGTQRKISVSFYVVALNEGEFPIMWEKINKLVTLVYPQYTKGRVLDYKSETGLLNDPSFKFIQPFSQMISASPLVRLRVGNVIRSNYTDEAMEDLFGAADPGMFQPNNEESHPSSRPLPAWKAPEDFRIYFNTDDARVLSKSRDRLCGDNRPTLEEIYKFIANNREIIEEITFTGRADERASVSYNHKLSEMRILSVVNKLSEGFRRISVAEKARLKGLSGESITRAVQVSNAISGAVNTLRTIDNNSLSVLGTNIKIIKNPEGETKSAQKAKKGEWSKDRVVIVSIKMKDRIQPTADAIKKDQAQFPTLTRGQLTDNFMNFGENSIVKTFKDTGAGGGLAGFLESLQFEWLNGGQITWDVNPGRKAPKLCKVTVDFSPIHDISPGLGWKGNNRAAVYNFNKVKKFDANNAPNLNVVKERPSVPLTSPEEGGQTPISQVASDRIEDEMLPPTKPTPDSTPKTVAAVARKGSSTVVDALKPPVPVKFNADGAPTPLSALGVTELTDDFDTRVFLNPNTEKLRLGRDISQEDFNSGVWYPIEDYYIYGGSQGQVTGTTRDTPTKRVRRLTASAGRPSSQTKGK